MASRKSPDERSKQRAIKRRVGGGRGDTFQVVIADARGGEHSFNLVGINADRADTPSGIKRFLKSHPDVLEKKRDEFARRYHIAKAKLDIENVKVKRISTFRKQPVHVTLRAKPRR